MKKAIFLYDFTGIMAQPWLDAGYECWCFDGQHPEGINREGNHVKVGMWFEPMGIFNQADEIVKIVGDDVCFVFGFPECTQLAVSGAAHFEKKRKENPLFQWEAIQLAHLVRLVGDAYKVPWAFENPVSVISSQWRKPDFSFNPYEYGGYLPIDDIHPTYPEYIKPRDAYPKKTCIWHGNGFIEPNRKSVGPSLHELEDGKLPPDFMHLVDELFYDDTNFSMYKKDGSPIWGYSDQHKKLGGKSLKTKNIRSATPRGFAKAVFIANS